MTNNLGRKKIILMKLPKLYKLSSTGKLLEWEIYTDAYTINIIFGQVGGKLQHDIENIKVGKNIGRTNETTPTQQAEAEALSKWTKKSEKEYRQNPNELTDKIISTKGGYIPMLAHKYKDHKDKLIYPCYVQRKYDGIRCISQCNNGVVTLWSRTGKSITTMQHIIDDLSTVMTDGDIFDGELYQHASDFNTFTGAIRGNVNTKDTTNIKYVIYDAPRIGEFIDISPYSYRLHELSTIITNLDHVYLTDTMVVYNFEQALEYFQQFIADNYEGIIFRNTDMVYEQKRSNNLLKYKEFDDAEFKIIGVEEGVGRLIGHAGSFVLDNGDGQTFKAKLKGNIEHLKFLFENPIEYNEKYLTVRFFGKSKDNIPRFPVGVSIRSYE